MVSTQKALLIGSSGLVGSHCLQLLLEDNCFSEVGIWVRKPSNISHPKLIEHVVNFAQINSFFPIKANVVFCCLGTTINKAGSKDAFREVDYWNVVRVAKAAKESGTEQFMLVSSIGANAASGNFYLRTKGETEQALSELAFSALQIFRPSILLGQRHEFRFGESIGKIFMQIIGVFLFGSARKYRGINASKVARTMVEASKQPPNGVTVWESDAIEAL